MLILQLYNAYDKNKRKDWNRMFLKNHFGAIVTVILSIIMGAAMSLAAVVWDHMEFNFSNVYKVWSMITLTVLMASLVLPYKMWGDRIGRLLSLREGTVIYKAVTALVPTLILNTCNTLLVVGANVFYNPEIPAELQPHAYISGVLHDWPFMLVISYCISFLAEAVGTAYAKKIIR